MLFLPKDNALKEDVRRLGELLGELLKDVAGSDFFALVEQVRQLARSSREGDGVRRQELMDLLDKLDLSMLRQLVRAFGAYFTVVNVAERIHRIRRRRSYLQEHGAPQPDGLLAVFSRLRAEGMSATQFLQRLGQLDLELVFTAHPTESTPRSVLRHEQRLMALLHPRSRQATLLIEEQQALWETVRETIGLLWLTDDLEDQPDVALEVEHVLFYVFQVLYPATPLLYEAIERTGCQVWPEHADDMVQGLAPNQLPPVLRFASWVGGDMDGHPFVGAPTIALATQRCHTVLMQQYVITLQNLSTRLSLTARNVELTAPFAAALGAYDSAFASQVLDEKRRLHVYPYRRFCAYLLFRLQGIASGAPYRYLSKKGLLADLQLLYDDLWQQGTGYFSVRRLQWQVATFGFHGVTLDLRTDAERVRQVAIQLGAKDSWWPTQGKIDDLADFEQAWKSQSPNVEQMDLSTPCMELLEAFRALTQAQQQYDAQAIGLCILSMTEHAQDLMALGWLARCALQLNPSQPLPFALTPLFETLEDLQRAPQVLRTLLASPIYRQHMAMQGNCQWIMLGYSDSNKGAGICASRWAIEQTERQLAQVAAEHQITLRFFHGRGGTASRGGSKPRQAILHDPIVSQSHHWRVTEQGEIIRAKYGQRDIAWRTIELMLGGMLEAGVGGEHTPIPQRYHALMDYFAQASCQAYRGLVQDKDFYRYFSLATPIDVIKRLRIGSRPASRKTTERLEDLRAIPWVFAWMQSRHMLPGWYGVGEGLQAVEQQFGLAAVQEAMEVVPMLKMLLSDVEMVLAKADMEIANHYNALAGPLGVVFGEKITSSFHQCCEHICRVLGTSHLLEKEAVLARSIALRNPYVDPMSLVQLRLLPKWRAQGCQEDNLLDCLLVTVKGIARGLQNTG